MERVATAVTVEEGQKERRIKCFTVDNQYAVDRFGALFVLCERDKSDIDGFVVIVFTYEPDQDHGWVLGMAG